MRRSIEGIAFSFKGCTIPPGFKVLLRNEYFHACPGQVTSTHKAAYTGAYYYGIINAVILIHSRSDSNKDKIRYEFSRASAAILRYCNRETRHPVSRASAPSNGR